MSTAPISYKHWKKVDGVASAGAGEGMYGETTGAAMKRAVIAAVTFLEQEFPGSKRKVFVDAGCGLGKVVYTALALLGVKGWRAAGYDLNDRLLWLGTKPFDQSIADIGMRGKGTLSLGNIAPIPLTSEHLGNLSLTQQPPVAQYDDVGILYAFDVGMPPAVIVGYATNAIRAGVPIIASFDLHKSALVTDLGLKELGRMSMSMKGSGKSYSCRFYKNLSACQTAKRKVHVPPYDPWASALSRGRPKRARRATTKASN